VLLAKNARGRVSVSSGVQIVVEPRRRSNLIVLELESNTDMSDN
jgi:hypothetical protein